MLREWTPRALAVDQENDLACGFINHFTSLSTQLNCVLQWKSGMPVGEYNLVAKTTKSIKEGNELWLNYGPLHLCMARIARKRMRSGHPREEQAKPATQGELQATLGDMNIAKS